MKKKDKRPHQPVIVYCYCNKCYEYWKKQNLTNK